jgi:hypothetical protein
MLSFPPKEEWSSETEFATSNAGRFANEEGAFLLPRKDVNVKIQELKTDPGTAKDFELPIGRIITEACGEEAGPTLSPSISDLREWDPRLLGRYKPFYLPFCDTVRST